MVGLPTCTRYHHTPQHALPALPNMVPAPPATQLIPLFLPLGGVRVCYWRVAAYADDMVCLYVRACLPGLYLSSLTSIARPYPATSVASRLLVVCGILLPCVLAGPEARCTLTAGAVKQDGKTQRSTLLVRTTEKELVVVADWAWHFSTGARYNDGRNNGGSKNTAVCCCVGHPAWRRVVSHSYRYGWTLHLGRQTPPNAPTLYLHSRLFMTTDAGGLMHTLDNDALLFWFAGFLRFAIPLYHVPNVLSYVGQTGGLARTRNYLPTHCLPHRLQPPLVTTTTYPPIFSTYK